MVDKYFR